MVIFAVEHVLCQTEHLLGREGTADGVVQEEVVELVGTHQVFGKVGHLTVLGGGQQLRGDGGGQHVVQDGGQLRIGLPVQVADVMGQVPHQGLGDGAVDGVHTHVVAVVGAPAQGQLGQVAGADDQAAVLVGDVHQDLSAFPRLAVFIGGGVVAGVVTDVSKVLHDRLADVHPAEGGAQQLTQLGGVVSGAVGGAEAGHGQGDDVRAGTTQHLHGVAGDHQRQGGVQTAGQANDGALGVGVLQTLLQRQRDHGEDLPAASGTVAHVGGDEGVGGVVTGQLGGGQLQGELHFHQTAIFHREGGDALALVGQALDVHFGGQQAGLEPALRQQGAVFGDHVMADEHQVGGGFAISSIGVHVSADQTAALVGDHVPAELILADGLVAGGQVQDDGSASGGQTAAGRHGHPQVFADLHADAQLRQLPAAEELIGAHGDGLVTEGDLCIHILAGDKPAGLVELAVVGDVALRHHTQNFPAREHHGAAVQFTAAADGHTDGGDQVQIAGLVEDILQCSFRALEQDRLEEQVCAGIGGDTQLRQSQHLDALGRGFFHQSNDLLCIVHTVGHPNVRGTGGDLYKSIPHKSRLPYLKNFKLMCAFDIWYYFTPSGVKMQGWPVLSSHLGRKKPPGWVQAAGMVRCVF